MKEKNKNILIILANPEKTSFSYLIEHKYRISAEKVGKNVETIDLYSPEYHQDYLKFDENGKPIINKETLIMQSKVKWADEIVFIFPIWRFDMPAILKNWLDTTMTSGFAYKHKVWSLQPTKFLKGKTARIFCNTWCPKWAMKLALIGTWLNRKFGRMGFVGINLKSFNVFWSRPRKQSSYKQSQYLKKVTQIAKL